MHGLPVNSPCAPHTGSSYNVSVRLGSDLVLECEGTGPVIWSSYTTISSQSENITRQPTNGGVERSWLVYRNVANSDSNVSCSTAGGGIICSYSVKVYSKWSLCTMNSEHSKLHGRLCMCHSAHAITSAFDSFTSCMTCMCKAWRNWRLPFYVCIDMYSWRVLQPTVKSVWCSISFKDYC